ncbi:MAG: EAL domain-containing protein [Rhodospirillales bacterium]|nr:EAL domain-containing protein [Rhodospirillales bacterium]
MANIGNVASMTGREATSEEILLRGRLRRVTENPAGMYAVHLHLSELRASNRAAHFIHIAARTFENLVNSYDTTLYQLSNADFVLLCRDVPVDDIDNAILKVRALFSEDPLTAAEDGSFEDRFTTWYDLSQTVDLAAFDTVVEGLVEELEERMRKEAEAAAAGIARSMSGEPLDPRNLTAINQKLLDTQIADLIQHQTAVEVLPNAKGQIMFDEYFIAMHDLQRRIAPNINLFGNNWLFQYLTETLDKRLLVVLARKDYDTLPEPISINLNVSTVLSREFQQFHRTVGENSSKVVVELQLIDIFADLSSYRFARDSLQEIGYSVLIDGLSPISLQYFDPSQLQPDFIKIGWASEYYGELDGQELVDLRHSIDLTGKEKLILGRVDTENAVKWGLSLGIRRFQGHYVDTIVDAMVTKGII